MTRNGTSSLLRSDSWSARGLCLLLSFVLLLLPSLSFAESLNDFLDNIELNLTAILSYSARLEEELQNSQKLSEQQKMQIEQLLIELHELKTRLEVSRSLLARYKNRAEELLSIIGQLEGKLTQLSASYKASEASWKITVQTAEKEIRVRKIRTVIIVVAVAAAAALGGYKIGKD